MSHPYPARFSAQVGTTIRALPEDTRKAIRAALERAQSDPFVFPQADRYDLDPTVRVLTTPFDTIVHYAVLPEHLWVFAIMVL